MREEKSLNSWIEGFGYEWKPGQEELMKGSFTQGEAQEKIKELRAEGKVKTIGYADPKCC